MSGIDNLREVGFAKKSRYRSAKFVITCQVLFGLLAVIAGIFLILLAFSGDAAVTMIPALSLIFGGLFVIGISETAMAVIDQADATRQLLALEQYKLLKTDENSTKTNAV